MIEVESFKTVSELRSEIAELQRVNELLKKRIKTEIKMKSKYKRLWQKCSAKQTKRETRCDMALKLIAKREDGEKIKLTDIAKDCFLSYSTVKALAYRYRKTLNN